MPSNTAQNVEPNADYDHLTVAGHSMGGDITMYFAKQYPDRCKKVITLDNLRVPFVTSGKFKTLSFRSHDPVFKTDPGVLPTEQQAETAGIEVVKTGFQHNDMRDTGSDEAKASIESMLDQFLVRADSSEVAPVQTSAPKILEEQPGPVTPYVPLGNESQKKSLTQ